MPEEAEHSKKKSKKNKRKDQPKKESYGNQNSLKFDLIERFLMNLGGIISSDNL